MGKERGFGSILGIIFAGIVAFCGMNGFLYTLHLTQRYDYILANALLIILIYLVYLTYEISQLKKK